MFNFKNLILTDYNWGNLKLQEKILYLEYERVKTVLR